MKRLVCALLVTGARIASADPHHILVLRAEGNADAGVRAKVDGQILKLAHSLDGNVEAGEISFTDASAAVGCSGSEAQCRDDVLATMGVDELISTSVSTSASGETKIVVRRMSKGLPTRELLSTIPAGQPVEAKLVTDVGPMFGAHADKTPGPIPTPGPSPSPSPTPSPNPIPTPPVQTAQGDTVTALPNNQLPPPADQPSDNRRLEIAGMATGGGLVLLSFLLWAEASSVQSDINNAPTKSPADFKHLQDLEGSGDGYASIGNLCFLSGLAIGGVAGYFFWRDLHAAPSAKQARIAPALFDHGGGLTLTIGGAP